METKKDVTKSAGSTMLVWTVGAVYALSLLYYFWVRHLIPSDIAEHGQFGDFVGGFLNPLVGIVTVYLFCHSLRQNDAALAQNNRMLQATLEELEQTKKALEDGQKIQKATEDALRRQIQIASLEKDFNVMATLRDMYAKDLEIIRYNIDVLQKSMDPAILPQIAELQTQHKNIVPKHTALSQLMNQDLDRVINIFTSPDAERLRAESLEKGFYKGYEYSLDFQSWKYHVKVTVVQPDDVVFQFSVGTEKPESVKHQDFLIYRRQSLDLARKGVEKGVDYHLLHGRWPSGVEDAK